MKRTSLRTKIRFFLSDLLDWIRMQIWLLVGRFFYSLRVDPRWEEEVVKTARRGRIVHVIRTAHLLDSLCLIYFSRKAGLPPIGYAYGLEQWFFRPFRWIYRFMTYHSAGTEDRQHVEGVLDEGGSIIICLRRTPKTLKVKGKEMGEEPLRWLMDRVRGKGEAIHLVPHAFVWGRRPEKHEKGVIDRIFGPRESPGVFRSVIQVIRSFRSANILMCEPIDLGAYMREFERGGEAGTMEGVLRRKLASAIDRRRTYVAGPATRSRYRTADLIMADPELVEAVKRQVAETGGTEDEARVKCRRMLDEIMPAYHHAFITGWEIMLKTFGVFEKVFDGIYVEDEEMETLRKLAMQGPIVLLPGHRSHVDYILLSWVFAHMSDIMVPYIAAGRNLSFWPLGWWFRGSGAFFIRRSMEGQELYRDVLAAFIRRIVRDRQHIEIFMEGTRSRSGKVLPPKLGLFKMVLDAVQELPPGSTVHFLPIAINYERVIEEQSYSREQAGSDKSGESIKGLVETQDVLESKYGRIYVRLGRPYSFDDICEEVPDPGDWIGIKRIAYKLFHEMDRAFHITPTGLSATVLLCGPGSGVSERQFFEDAVFYLKFAAATGKKVSEVLRPCLGLENGNIGNEHSQEWRVLREVLYHAIHLLADDDLVSMTAGGGGVYYVPEAARVRLDYYKNTFCGTMAPHTLACKSLLTRPPGVVDIHELKSAAAFLSKLFKYEFIFNPLLPFDANFQAVLSMLESMGFLEVDTSRKTVKTLRREEVEKVGSLVHSLLETYYVTAQVIAREADREMSEREIVRRAFRLHERLVLERKVSRAEARNRSAATFCLKALREMGVLRRSGDRRYAIRGDYGGEDALEELAARIYSFLRPETEEGEGGEGEEGKGEEGKRSPAA